MWGSTKPHTWNKCIYTSTSFFDGARLLAPYNSSIVNMAAPLQLK